MFFKKMKGKLLFHFNYARIKFLKHNIRVRGKFTTKHLSSFNLNIYSYSQFYRERFGLHPLTVNY